MEFKDFVLLGVTILIFTGCNDGTTTENEDLFSVSAIISGEVLHQSTKEPVVEATIYLNERGSDCKNSILAEPTKFDSTLTNKQGQFTLKVSFLNIQGPICLESFAMVTNEDQSIISDTVQFNTPLKREEPFDTTKVNLIIEP